MITAANSAPPLPSALPEAEKITPPEIIFSVLWSAFADIFEIVGGFVFSIPYVGWGIWLLAATFGVFTSAVIAIWLWFRGGSFGAAKKLTTFILGALFDSLTTGILPIRTIALCLAIWMHNHPKLTALTTGVAKAAVVK